MSATLLNKPAHRLSCKTRDPSWHAAVLTLRDRRLSLLNGQWQQMTKIQQQHHKRQVKKVQAELKQLAVQRRKRAKSTETFNRMQLQLAMNAIIANIPLLQGKGPEQDRKFPDLPEWVQQSHQTHQLLWISGLLVCRRCGGTRTADLYKGKTLLLLPCEGLMPVHRERRLRQAKAGKPPEGHQRWPDGSPAGPRPVWALPTAGATGSKATLLASAVTGAVVEEVNRWWGRSARSCSRSTMFFCFFYKVKL